MAFTFTVEHGFAARFVAGAVVLVWQGVIQRSLAFRWGPEVQPELGLMAGAGVGMGLPATAGQRPRASKP